MKNSDEYIEDQSLFNYDYDIRNKIRWIPFDQKYIGAYENCSSLLDRKIKKIITNHLNDIFSDNLTHNLLIELDFFIHNYKLKI